MYIAYPVIRDGEVAYVIGATMNFRYWTRWLQAHTPPSLSGGILDGNHVLLSRTFEAEKVVGQPVQPWYRDVLAAGAPSGMVRGQSVTGADVVAAYQRSALSGWTVNVFTSGAVLDAPMRRTAFLVSAGVLAALLIAAWLATRRSKVIEREHRDSEAALRQSEAKFRNIASAAPALVWVTDPGGNVTFLNDHGTAYLGMPLEKALGMGWAQARHPDDAVRLRELRERCYRTGETYEGEIRYRRHDGMYRWHVFRVVASRRPDGSIDQWVGCAIDIHDAREAQEALKEADRRKDEFLATLAHELRNPLAPIRNALQLLNVHPAADESLRAAQDMMDRQVRHMVRLIDDLLDVSRITRGRLELRREPVALSRVLEQALETSRPHITQQLTVALPSEPAYLDADPVRLAQVLSNLLNNAAKFTPRAGRISIAASREGGQVVIRVRDNGIGIARDELPAIFRMFSQGALERSRGGLGIGLALARSLVELHGGTIEAHSEGPGKGSEFVVRLPVLPAPDPAALPPAKAAEPYAGAVRRVLVVDDVQDNVSSLSQLLAMDGHRVEGARGGLEAVEKAEAFKPDVILLDLGLPDLSGVEVCQLIRHRPWGREIVIVALTGWGQDEDRARTLAAGFDAHLVKPVSYEAIRKLLASPLMA